MIEFDPHLARWQIGEDGMLRIYIPDFEGIKADNMQSIAAYTRKTRRNTEEVENEFYEALLANGLTLISAEQVEALTDAPLLALNIITGANITEYIEGLANESMINFIDQLFTGSQVLTLYEDLVARKNTDPGFNIDEFIIYANVYYYSDYAVMSFVYDLLIMGESYWPGVEIFPPVD